MGYRLPVGGGGYFRLFPFAVTRYCLQLRSRQTNAPFCVLSASVELDPSQPRVQGASLISKFRHYNNLHKVESRLLRLFDLFDFDTVQAVLDDVEYFPHTFLCQLFLASLKNASALLRTFCQCRKSPGR